MTLTEILLVIILVVAALAVVGSAVAICFLVNLRNKMVVQRLKFVGLYSQDKDTRENYAEFVIGNRSLNEVGISQIGLKNGSITFDLTAAYKNKAGLRPDERLLVEQRGSLKYTMSEKELAEILIDGKKGKMLGSLKLYCIDFTGTLYEGKVRNVKKLAQKVLNDIKGGNAPTDGAPPSFPAEHEEPSSEE